MRYLCALFLLFATPALAGRNDTEWNPPAAYDRTYAGEVIIHFLPPSVLSDKCTKTLNRFNIPHRKSNAFRGCSVKQDGKCTIWVIDRPAFNTKPKAVIRHEMGHCNGWSPNHD